MDQCIFCKIINKEIPAEIILENDKFIAFNDISPVAKYHVLVIPKSHVQSISHVDDKNEVAIHGMFQFIKEVAAHLHLDKDGYRTVLNTGNHAGQTVHHLHAHIIGGQQLGWPGV